MVNQVRRGFDPVLAFILLLPIGLYLLNDAWAFGAEGVDTWYYYGHFFNWADILQIHPDDYIGTRLSYILPGYLLNVLFEPVTAKVLLAFIVYWAAAFPFYLTLRLLAGARAALFGLLWFGLHVTFISATGWTYVDGAGIAYTMLATFAVVKAATAEKGRFAWLALAGAMFANAVYTNLFLVVFGAAHALLYLWLSGWFAGWRMWPQAIAWALGGFLTVTVLLGGINVIAGGDFLFFMPSLDFAQYSIENLDSLPVRPSMPWHHLADHIVLPVLAAVLSLVGLWRLRQEPRLRLLMLVYLLVFGLFAVMELLSIRVLQTRFYVTFLLPYAFFALAAFMTPTLRDLPGRWFVGLCVVVAGLSVLPLISDLWREWARIPAGWDVPVLGSVAAVVVGFGLLLAALLFAGHDRRRVAVSGGLLAATVALSITGYRAIINDVQFDTTIQNQVSYLERDYRDLMLAAYDTIQAVQAVTPDTSAYFWLRFPATWEEGRYHRSIAATHMRSLVGPFPRVGNFWTEVDLYDGMVIVLYEAEGEDLLDRALETLAGEGYDASVVEERAIAHGDFRFTLTFLRLHSMEAVSS